MQSAVPLKIQFLLVHAVLQRFTGLKNRSFCLANFDFLARAGIARRAGGTGAHFEGAEVYQLYLIACTQRLRQRFNHCIQGPFYAAVCHFGFASNGPYQFALVHAFSPLPIIFCTNYQVTLDFQKESPADNRAFLLLSAQQSVLGLRNA